MSEDSVTAPLTLNRYTYCWGNPVRLVDLDGRVPGEWEYGEATDYEGVYYLNAEKGAFNFGHAALLFVREDGSGTFYSFAASTNEAANIILGNDVPGYLSKADLDAADVEVFLGRSGKSYEDDSIVPGAGQIETDGIDGSFTDGERTPYSRYIYIPITTEQGKVMSYYAEYLRDQNGTGTYNLYSRNCGMVAQDILRYGGVNFAAGSEEGKNTDEQIALAEVAFSLLVLQSGLLAGLVVSKAMIKDYADQTMPNASYNLGWMLTNIFLSVYGWKTGEIEQGEERGVHKWPKRAKKRCM